MKNNGQSSRKRSWHRKRTMNIGCWNIQGISTKVNLLPEELKNYNMDIVVLSETKKKGRGEEMLGDFLHFWSGVPKNSRAKAGVSFAIHKRLKDKITGWECINERMMILHTNIFSREISFIGTYAPTNDMSEIIKDQYWDLLKETIERIPRRKEIFVLGDMNARVGNERIKNVMDVYGENERNDNGERLIEMCEEMNLKISNTFFQHKEIHKFTWRQETRKLKSIIDYVLLRQTSSIQLLDVRSYRGAECGTDHYLVKAKCLLPWRKTQHFGKKDAERIQQENFNIELLQDESIRSFYQHRMDKELDENFGKTVEEIYNYIKDKIKKIAYETLGTKLKNDRMSWLPSETREKVERKKELYLKWLQSKKEEHRKEYVGLKNDLKYEIRSLNNDRWEMKCAEINAEIGFSRSKQSWKVLKEMRKEANHRININLISLAEWTTYYSQLLQEHRENLLEEEYCPEDIELIISEDEVRKVLIEGKNGKAPGSGGINLELIKYGGGKIRKLITRLMNSIIQEGKIPEEMNRGFISSIHKKGDKKQCSNYRGICVINSVMKIFGKIVKNRLEREFETSEEQCGFTAGKSGIDHLFTIRQLLQKSYGKMKDIHMIFIDLEKAYDSVPRKLLWKALEAANISKSLINLVRLMYKNNTCQIKVGSRISEEFKTSKGLLQGCCMSPTLFKIYMDVVLNSWKKKCEKMGIQLANDKYLFNLLFADDQVIIAQEEDDIDYMMRKLLDTYTSWGLNINFGKTEYLTSGHQKDLIIEGQLIKNVSQFKYLGSELQEQGQTDIEIKKRMTSTRRAISMLNSVLWSKNIITKTKKTIYNTIIESILLYSAETWTINKKTEKKLLAVEMDYWRRAARRSRLERKTNTEIRNQLNVKTDIITKIDERRLRWFGHVRRMADNRLPKLLMDWEPEGRNRRGRPRKRRRDNLTENINRYHLRAEDAENRNEWRKKLRDTFG